MTICLNVYTIYIEGQTFLFINKITNRLVFQNNLSQISFHIRHCIMYMIFTFVLNFLYKTKVIGKFFCIKYEFDVIMIQTLDKLL